MIDTPARRREIIEILYFADDYIKMRPLAVRFGVSYATIRNDVDVLSLSYRISSQTGPNGGIKLETKKNLRFLDPDETAALLRIMYIVPEAERVYIRSILRDLALIDDK
ncbi:MAG: HTH domain-containing protein [Subdoligranulum variabile]|nr:HTH domain-containing protein [Subdoligranulum variabile]